MTAPLYEVSIEILGDRSWCIKQQEAIRERLQATTISLDCLPSVDVAGDPAQLVLRWINLPFNSGDNALQVARVTAEDLLPGFGELPFVSLSWSLLDPNDERRRPVD